MNILEKNDKQKGATWLGVLFLVETALSVGLMLLASAGVFDKMPMLFTMSLAELSILIPSGIYIFVKKLSWKDDLGFKKIKAGTVVMTVIATILLSPITSFVNVLSQFFVPNTMTQASDTLTEAAPWFVILFYAGVIAPICEEIAFRGVFGREMNKVASLLKASLVSGLLFALFHMNLNQMAYAFVLGTVFAIVNIASGSIITSIICHVLINTFNMGLLLAMNAVMKVLGEGVSIAQASETARQQKGMLVIMAAVYGVLAVIAFFILRVVIKWIAENEGNYEVYRTMFSKRKGGNDQTDIVNAGDDDKQEITDVLDDKQKEARVLLNVPMMIGVIACAVIIIIDMVAA